MNKAQLAYVIHQRISARSVKSSQLSIAQAIRFVVHQLLIMAINSQIYLGYVDKHAMIHCTFHNIYFDNLNKDIQRKSKYGTRKTLVR